MPSLFGRFTIFALALLLAPSVAMPASGPCSSDTFTIDGVTLVADVCGPSSPPPSPAGKPVTVAVSATFSVNGRPPIARKIAFDLLSAEQAAHTIDDVALGPLGIAKTLHVTIGYKAGIARLEHALLVPGAIALK